MKVPRWDWSGARSAAVRALWFAMLPLLAAGWVVRYLVPTPAAARGGWAEPIARLGDGHPLVLYLVLFLVFSSCFQYWTLRILGDRSAGAASRAQRRWVWRGAAALIALGVALLARSYVSVHTVKGTAMLPTLEPGDLVAGTRPIARRARGTSNAHLPRRGDIVIFKNQEGLGEGESGALRVIGLPGDHIAMQGHAPVINGWQVPVCRASTYIYPILEDAVRSLLVVEFLGDGAHLALYDPSAGSWPRTYDVKEGEVFVLGDNRATAGDSRGLNRGMGGGVPVTELEARGQRWLIGKRRDEVTDFSRWYLPIDGQLHLDGMDTAQTREAIERCMALRPNEINPPEPTAESSPTARGG